MPEIILCVDDLRTSYKNFCIKNISFRLKSGDIMGLVGRSGSGKSTVIKTLVGEKKPDHGIISSIIDSKEMPLKKVIGYSPQENSLFQYLTLEENILTFGKLWGIKRDVITKRMDFLLRRLDLQKCREKRINQLSGGMQKRADLAVTLIHSPKIIILDEPFNGLDISLQRFIWNLLLELSEAGRIIIISSHMLSDIQKNCNHFGLVSHGQFYNNSQIMHRLNGTKGNLRDYLEKLFTYDLMKEDQKAK